MDKIQNGTNMSTWNAYYVMYSNNSPFNLLQGRLRIPKAGGQGFLWGRHLCICTVYSSPVVGFGLQTSLSSVMLICGSVGKFFWTKMSTTGVSSRGLRGEPPLLKFLLIFGGLAPLKLLHWLGFSESIGLVSKVLCSIVHCYMVIEAFLLADYTISVLN